MQSGGEEQLTLLELDLMARDDICPLVKDVESTTCRAAIDRTARAKKRFVRVGFPSSMSPADAPVALENIQTMETRSCAKSAALDLDVVDYPSNGKRD